MGADVDGGDPPGILGLLELIEEHPAAFAYDWRTRFRMPTDAIGVGMSWGEAWLLVQGLSRDPSSHVAAAIAGWRYPMGREALVLADLFDLTHAAHAQKRAKPYPRPWKQRSGSNPLEPSPLTPEQRLAVLMRHRTTTEGSDGG